MWVINNIKAALPKLKDALGEDGKGIDVQFQFDQSPYVTRAVAGVVTEGVLGAADWSHGAAIFARLAKRADCGAQYSAGADGGDRGTVDLWAQRST